MIIGSGLLARAFTSAYAREQNVCIYAAGVSNSGCEDTREFFREQERLAYALNQFQHAEAFVYFGTCSVSDPEALNTRYVQHKLAMEKMVHAHPQNMVLRLPQVAGKTPNPHTLLNFLYARISRSETFNLWSKAKRNIIDADDIVSIALQLIANDAIRKTTINVANTSNYSMSKIVGVMEEVVGKRAIFDVVDRGSDCFIDTGGIQAVLVESGVEFGENYLNKVIAKYYERTALDVDV